MFISKYHYHNYYKKVNNQNENSFKKEQGDYFVPFMISCLFVNRYEKMKNSKEMVKVFLSRVFFARTESKKDEKRERRMKPIERMDL